MLLSIASNIILKLDRIAIRQNLSKGRISEKISNPEKLFYSSYFREF